jgi:hypothetical protein
VFKDGKILTTIHGLKSQSKYGIDWHYKYPNLVKSGGIVRYNPIRCYMYWQKGPAPLTAKLTVKKEYIIEYAYSSVIQVKCDTGKIVSYGSLSFEMYINDNWVRL